MHGDRKYKHYLGEGAVMHGDRKYKHYRPKVFSVPAALAYAEDNASGKNEDAIGRTLAELGNPEGAARLCRWALTKQADKRRECPVCQTRADVCFCGFNRWVRVPREESQG